MAEYYNFDNKEPITMEINEPEEEEVVTSYKENEIFDKKAKPKRVLTDSQKEALQRGRAKAKATREAKKMEQMKKQLAQEDKKTSIKVERQQLQKAEVEATEQLKTKRQKKTAQDRARERIKQKKNERDKEDQKKIDSFNDLKYACLENCDTEEDFDKLDTILNKYITKSDIIKGNDHLRNKVGQVVSLLKK